jgi:hypothetical protein
VALDPANVFGKSMPPRAPSIIAPAIITPRGTTFTSPPIASASRSANGKSLKADTDMSVRLPTVRPNKRQIPNRTRGGDLAIRIGTG